jgi:hypothetical protein
VAEKRQKSPKPTGMYECTNQTCCGVHMILHVFPDIAKPFPAGPVSVGHQMFKELSTQPLDANFPDQVIRLSADDWMYPLLAHNPRYRDRLARLFPHGRAFAHIAAFLLPLAPALQAKVDVVKRHMHGRNTIGMHLRLQKVRTFFTTRWLIQWSQSQRNSLLLSPALRRDVRGLPDDA